MATCLSEFTSVNLFNSSNEVLIGGTLASMIVPHVLHEFRLYSGIMSAAEIDTAYNSLVTKWGGQSFV